MRAARRRVSVDVGPFADFSQLVRFEDAANAIGGTGDISIKRFSEGRARIDVAVSEPVDLLRELEERCDIDFKVRSHQGRRDRPRRRRSRLRLTGASPGYYLTGRIRRSSA